MKKLTLLILLIALFGCDEAIAQWNTSGNNIYNTNTGNVGIGSNAPSTLLCVAKDMTEPTVTVRNLGGFGGATYTMIDDASGADWKFKATLSGGFKIRDHANLMDVIVIEPNSFANAIFIKSAGNIGIGTATPESTAILDLQANDKGFLLPRLTQPQIASITDPADGLQVYSTTDGKIYIFVAVANEWKEVAYGAGIISPPFTCGSSLQINHVAGDVAPVNKTVTYGTVTNIPGETSKCWITSNLGADHQATAVNDATEASAGWYWQFNRMQGYKHDGTTVTPAWTITLISENSAWLSENDPCSIELGNGWRLPTYTEWVNVDETGGWTNWNGPWTSALKLHAAGYIFPDGGLLDDRGTYGTYWSNTQYEEGLGWDFRFFPSFCEMGWGGKAIGKSVRCCRD